MIPGRFAQAAGWPDLRGKPRLDKPWLDGFPRMIFVGDMGDFLSRGVTDEFLVDEMFTAITSAAGQRHFWLLLTKRPRRLAELSEKIGQLPDNCMAMTTVTDQETADRRIPQLLRVRCRWRGLSVEPLLGAVDLNQIEATPAIRISALYRSAFNSAAVDWVIGGGESGPGAEPTHPMWAIKLLDQCQAAGVPFFWKQWGEWVPISQNPDAHGPWFDRQLKRLGKKGGELPYHCWEDLAAAAAQLPDANGAQITGLSSSIQVGRDSAGRLLGGREWNEIPALFINEDRSVADPRLKGR